MERLREFLRDREAKGLLRALRPAAFREESYIYIKNKKYIDLSSNDYLGFATHPRLKEASQKAASEFGTGSAASRLLSGDLDMHHRLEEAVASFKGKEAALTFNSGYQANVGIISALYGRGDAIFSDRLCHASIIDGMMLSGAKLFRFRHNDPEDLESLLKRQRRNFKNGLIVTETIFSMDGDRAPLGELAALKERYDCRFMVDEAHATGVFGNNGSGVVEAENLSDRIDMIMGTFSKALGSFGAYLACSNTVKEYLINRCRSFIYSTALPPAVIAANLAALQLVNDEPLRRKSLLENAGYLREELRRSGFTVKGSSQIIPVIIGDDRLAVKMAGRLQDMGYWILAIRQPTIPAGEARLRLSMTYYHTKDIIQGLIDDIRKIEHI